MYVQKLIMVLLASASLIACRSGGTRAYYDDGYNYSRGGYNYNSFDVVDSYDVDSRRSGATLTLDSVNADGTFQAFWSITTDEPYEARLFINTAPIENGRRTLGYAYCGGSDKSTCYLSEGTFYCAINYSGVISCEDGRGSDQINDWLLNTHRFYLGLEICSSRGYGCRSKYREVTIY